MAKEVNILVGDDVAGRSLVKLRDSLFVSIYVLQVGTEKVQVRRDCVGAPNLGLGRWSQISGTFHFTLGSPLEPAQAWLVKQDLKSVTQEVVTEGPWT